MLLFHFTLNGRMVSVFPFDEFANVGFRKVCVPFIMKYVFATESGTLENNVPFISILSGQDVSVLNDLGDPGNRGGVCSDFVFNLVCPKESREELSVVLCFGSYVAEPLESTSPYVRIRGM